MRPASFFALLAMCITVQALPIAFTLADVSAGTLTSEGLFSTALSPVATSSPVAPTDSVSDVNSTAAIPTASTTDTSSDPASTDNANGASQTDPSIASATDDGSSDASSTVVTDSSASPSSTATGDRATGTDSPTSSAAQPTSTSVSFDIPVVPPACLALASGAQTTSLPTSTIASTAFTTLPPSGSSSLSNNTIISTIASNATATPSVTGSSAVSALPTDVASNGTLSRRIAQDDLPAVAQAWQDLCLVSGGDIFTNEPCVQLAGVNGINALLAHADPCAQQDNADAMIDFAKSPGVTNSAALIANAVAYRQHPRNVLDISGVLPSTPFCQRAPRNAELAGVVNGQLDGLNAGIFGSVGVGLFAFGADGSCPFGQVPDDTTCTCS
ncbi:hypothetical protein BN946_scf185002.g123 [Trametes cinnabarina]|uniref:Uncharacterized protein n=1 Tax=Pycnoporus cinnabarinus TaxID=5643 RepID=A0A060SKJ3_PYCCI|nr:hypothetical protein BN946_scf185002.g123 [Trametes cinnabarina]